MDAFSRVQLLGVFPRLEVTVGLSHTPVGRWAPSPPPPEPVLHLRSEGIEANAFEFPSTQTFSVKE